MLFSPPLTEAIITERINRFQAMIQLPNASRPQICYVPNTGSMKTAWVPQGACAIAIEHSPKKKSPYTLVMTQDQQQQWVGIHTGMTNRLVKEFLQQTPLTSLYQPEHYELQSEKTIGRSRFDFVLIPKSITGLSASEIETKKVILLEVKNVSMIDETHPDVAQFPDSISTRAQKHVEDFIALQGTSAAPSGFPELQYQTVLLFVVQRDHCKSFKPAQLIDPRYAALLREAAQSGVTLLAYGCQMGLEEIKINPQNPLRIELQS